MPMLGNRLKVVLPKKEFLALQLRGILLWQDGEMMLNSQMLESFASSHIV